MNDAIQELRKRGKKKSKLEQLLLIDHSDIYFENERLGEKLGRILDEIHTDEHKFEMQHKAYITELKQEIESLHSMKKSSSEQTKKLLETLEKISAKSVKDKKEEKKKIRPHTTGSYFARKKFSNEREDIRTQGNQRVRIRSQSDPEDSGSEHDRPVQPKVSGMKRYKQVGKKSRKDKFPKEWYTTVLQASDACLKRVRQEFRRQQTAPSILLHSKKERKSSVSSRADSEVAGETETPAGSKSKLLPRKSKPALMSLRKMKELTHMDSAQEKTRNRQQEKLEHCLQSNKERIEYLSIRIQDFLEAVEDKISRDIEESQEKPKEVETDMYFGLLPPDQMEPPSQ